MWRLHCKDKQQTHQGGLRHRIIRNHRTAWVAKDHNDHQFHPPAMCRVANQQPRLPRATSSLASNACRDGASPQHTPALRVSIPTPPGGLSERGGGDGRPRLGTEHPASTSSLLRAVESHVVFLGFRSGTHSPPRSKVMTDWMELSAGGTAGLAARPHSPTSPPIPPPELSCHLRTARW